MKKQPPAVISTTVPAVARLSSVTSALSSPNASPQTRKLLGHLTSGSTLRLPVYEAQDQARLPVGELLDARETATGKEIAWLMKKWELGQDVFLISAPGPFARRLALTFLSLMNTPFEYVSLHRDIGEGELKQTREIREGGNLEFVDGPVVRAAKEGKTLILEGIERCERGILPLLNNLLENREMNLEDGTHIIAPSRYDLLVQAGESTATFIKCHPDFRVVAIGSPVPPFPGLPTDPPFRSRFQSRYLDSVLANRLLALRDLQTIEDLEKRKVVEEKVEKLAEAVLTLQIQKEMRAKMVSGISTSDSDLPLFPQTSLSRFARFLLQFPPSPSTNFAPTNPAHFLNLLCILHPKLSYVPKAAKRALEELLKSVGFEEWAEGLSECEAESVYIEGNGEGIWGWKLVGIARETETTAKLTFEREDQISELTVPCGPYPFRTWPLTSDGDLHLTTRFLHLLTSTLQLHALGFDISLVPSSISPAASSSTSRVISTFASLLGYSLDVVHLYKEIGGRELWMRREVGGQGGVTSWAESALVKGMKQGSLVWLESIDTIGPTVGSLGRLFTDRQGESFEGKRLIAQEVSLSSPILEQIHPSFRIITTSSKATPPTEWLSEELTSNLSSLPSFPMSMNEERQLLLSTGCPTELVDLMETFATKYRLLTSMPGNKARRLGTASLLRMAKRLALYPSEDVQSMIERTLLVQFLPITEQEQLYDLFAEIDGLKTSSLKVHPPPEVEGDSLVFRSRTLGGEETRYEIKIHQPVDDPENLSLVPHMDVYLDNQDQTILMRDIGLDLQMKQHILLLGNQGVGKNKIIDRLLQLLQRAREYVQLSRDTTTQSLLSSIALENGVLRSLETPLIRAIRKGRVIFIDEVDKASPNVVAALSSLASRGELTLPNGTNVRPPSFPFLCDGDIVVHPDFRMILAANRPGYPFLGNNFISQLGDHFSSFPVPNPDFDSEFAVLSSLAPELPVETLQALTHAFQDLRVSFDKGTITYPFSLRELLAVVRHMKRFPEPLEDILRNIFDFDVHSPATLDALYDSLRRYKLNVERVGIDAVRGSGGGKLAGKDSAAEEDSKAEFVEFEPTGDTSLTEPKYGKVDDEEHSGGNTWAGGTGGRDTAGSGGRGGYMRLLKGGKVKQIPDSLKKQVPEEISDRAREMARKELAQKLREVDLSSSEASTFSRYYNSISSHIQSLVTFLENLEAREEERVWLKRQTDGDLDETRITEGLTGESTVYKRRGLEKPEIGQPQLKPKRIRFVFDLSASLYRQNFDGRLTRSLEALVMVLESFSRLSPAGQAKYRIDLVGHSGEEKSIPLVQDVQSLDAGAIYKVLAKAALIPQYCFAGDNTIEAIEAAVDKVGEEVSESDECFVIALTDANFERYGITEADLRASLNRNTKVATSLIAIGEGAECEWLARSLPGKAYRVKETSDLARTLKSILGKMLGGSL